jgi:hypothetical protein
MFVRLYLRKMSITTTETIEVSPKFGHVEYSYEVTDEIHGKKEYYVTLFAGGEQVETATIHTNNIEDVHKTGNDLYESFKDYLKS